MFTRTPRGAQAFVGLRGAPDTPTINRVLTLQATIGAGLQGRAGQNMGYDRGDPATSLTGPVASAPSPTAGYAAVTAGGKAGYRPTPVVQDAALTDPTLDPYNALLLARMNR